MPTTVPTIKPLHVKQETAINSVTYKVSGKIIEAVKVNAKKVKTKAKVNGKKVKRTVIRDKVQIGGKKYKVTGIGKNAFRNFFTFLVVNLVFLLYNIHNQEILLEVKGRNDFDTEACVDDDKKRPQVINLLHGYHHLSY